MTFIFDTKFGDRSFPGAPPPAVARVAEAHPRFRVQGSGPVSGRLITPATQAARDLLATTPGVTDAVRGVLRLVEQEAGGAAASSSVRGSGTGSPYPH